MSDNLGRFWCWLRGTEDRQVMSADWLKDQARVATGDVGRHRMWNWDAIKAEAAQTGRNRLDKPQEGA